MATTTASAVKSGTPPRAVHAGLQAAHSYYNSGSLSLSTSAHTVFMLKVPHGAKIHDLIALVSSGAGTMPTDIGRVGSLTEFGSATIGVTFHATKGLPYTVSATTTGYEIFTATTTLATDTKSCVINLTAIYDMSDVT